MSVEISKFMFNPRLHESISLNLITDILLLLLLVGLNFNHYNFDLWPLSFFNKFATAI